MTIKLVGSTSGSVALDAPASTTSGANIEFKLPVADGSANQVIKTDGSGQLAFAGSTSPLQVLEEFYVPCNGTAVTTAQGSVSIQNVTAAQTATDSLADVNGSSISYQPPANTKLVIYTFSASTSYDTQTSILGFQPYLDDVRLSACAIGQRVNDYHTNFMHFVHGFRIESSADASIGQVTSWNSAKTIKLQFRRWNSSHSGKIHIMGEGFQASDGAFANNVFRIPNIGIKAIGSI